MAKQEAGRKVFLCSECGDTVSRWEGRCPHCGTWNALVETTLQTSRRARSDALGHVQAQELAAISSADLPRRRLSLGEVDRVLGGGLVPGSVVLLAGDPGIGKSTLLLQVASVVAQATAPVLYVTGEESPQQVKLRAQRLNLSEDHVYLLAETDVEAVLATLERMSPALVIVDSVQTLQAPDVPSTPGSIAQVRESTQRLMAWAKSCDVPLLLAGHVTKDGVIAGPRVLEHMVDVVLYLEGDPVTALRLLRGVKNRFGSTNEVGVFEMRGSGLVEVPEPSKVLLAGRREETVGSVVTATLEGLRPLLVEVQGLTTPTVFPAPRRTGNGVEMQRLLLVLAVLSRRLGFSLGSQDVMVNVVGGLRLSEPAADLAMALAIASSLRDTPLRPSTVAIGEVGLGGEVRQVPQLERRVQEVARLGFRRVVVPTSPALASGLAKGMEVVPVADVRQALREALMPRPPSAPQAASRGSSHLSGMALAGEEEGP